VNTPSTSISPGLGGFLAFFVLAIALWLLMRNMNARMRRMSYKAEEEARRAQQEASSQRPAPEGDGPAGDAAHDGQPDGERAPDSPGGERQMGDQDSSGAKQNGDPDTR
jgi:hypothetical protein